MKTIKYLLILFLILTNNTLNADDNLFDVWLKNFKVFALKNDISEITFDMAMSDVVFIPQVIKYDRFQPEFYEDTKTYISKRTSNQKLKQGAKLYRSNSDFIDLIDNKFFICFI